MNSPFFSIIIPTYNSESTLVQCMESILQQTYVDYEVLIIDGCSIDSTCTIAKQYQNSFPNFQFISEKDEGIYDAMNKGIKMSKGEWLYFMGSDDRFFNNDILAIVNDKVNSLHCDVIYGNVSSVILGEKYDGIFDKNKILYKNICHQSIFFKKSIFEITGLFNLKYRAYADWNHNFSWLLNPKINKVYINEVIAYYAAGGFSEKNGDPIFEKDKIINYLISGKDLFTLIEKLVILKTSIVNAFRRYDFQSILRVLIYFPNYI